MTATPTSKDSEVHPSNKDIHDIEKRIRSSLVLIDWLAKQVWANNDDSPHAMAVDVTNVVVTTRPIYNYGPVDSVSIISISHGEETLSIQRHRDNAKFRNECVKHIESRILRIQGLMRILDNWSRLTVNHNDLSFRVKQLHEAEVELGHIQSSLQDIDISHVRDVATRCFPLFDFPEE